MDNSIIIPYLNPVKFYKVGRANLDKYFTKHFDDFMFTERLYSWQDQNDYIQPWQTTDIINLQFESTFDPIIVELLDKYDQQVLLLPALVGLPNKYYSNTKSYEISMSLAGLPSGCYRMRVNAGIGDEQGIYISNWMYISSTPYNCPSLMLEYWHSRFHEDIIFETGIKFQYRLFGHLGFLNPGRDIEGYKDEKYNPSILSSRTFRKQEVVFGDEYGLPDDVIDILNRIWGCNNVMMDNKSFAAITGSAFEFETADRRYKKRGVRMEVEEGNNRASNIFAVDTDTTKKLVYGIMVDAKVWGDTSNQGSSNTVPIHTIE